MNHLRTPVVAAVPNYNMGESLANLLPALLEQQYDRVYVLDDNSTDGSREVAEAYGPEVCFVPGAENVGAGANRNRLLGVLSNSCIIHFIDADMNLVTRDNPDRIRAITRDRAYAFIGGMILEEAGLQFPFNYGPTLNLRHKLKARKHYHIAQLAKTDSVAARTKRINSQDISEWPDTLDLNQPPRQVDWATEGNIIIDSEVFKRLQGFDPKLRHHEIQDFAIRGKNLGLNGYFDPSVVTLHKNIDVRGNRRRTDAYKALWQLGRKHGFVPMLSWR